MAADGTEIGSTPARRASTRRRALIALLVSIIVVPLAMAGVAAAQPSPPAPTLTASSAPQGAPIPDGLWDVAAPNGDPGNYVVMEGAEGDEVTRGNDLTTFGARILNLYDPAIGQPAVPSTMKRLIVFATTGPGSSGRAVRIVVAGPGGDRITEPGFYDDVTADSVNPQGTYLEAAYFDPNGRRCGDDRTSGPPPELTGWVAIDRLEIVDGAILKLDLRLEQSCQGQPPLHAKVHIDNTPTVRPIPDGLWDVQPDGVTGDYVYIDGEPGDGVTGGGDRLIAGTQGAGRQVPTSYRLEAFTGAADGTIWTGAFGGFDADHLLGPGLYLNASSVAEGNPIRPYIRWWEANTAPCAGPLTGWFAIDDISWMEEGSGSDRLSYVTKLDLRFEQSCDGAPPIHGKLHVADRTPPGPEPLSVPEGLWEASHQGAPSFGWAAIEGAPGDPVTDGDVVSYEFRDGVGAGTVDDEIRTMVGGSTHYPFLVTLRGPDEHPLGVGYYPLATGPDDRRPGRASVHVARSDSSNGSIVGECPGAVSGWIAIDHIAAVGEEIRQLDLRFEQRCDGSLPMHGQVHLEMPIFPTTTTSTSTTSTTAPPTTSTTVPTPPPLSRPPGPPFGAVDVLRAAPGGVQVSGWVIDPDTAASTDVHVYVDGVGKALHADGSRPDVANAYSGYGPAHGFGATIPASPGVHNVCVYGINVGAGANSTLACRTVNVLGGSPVGSLDVARQGPQVVAVAGWALDFDTADPIPVHVYVDGKGTAVTANSSRPDVGSAYPGYGSAHGFSVSIPATPGQHQVCVYGINTGAGANSLIGCRTVSVSTGSPIGTIDVTRGGPGWVSLGGWALDPDTGAPIPVHVYVDSKGTALTADGNRPDVGAFFQGWGNAHGYATTISAPPGVHNVCAYAINVGPGANNLLGCRAVTVT